MERKKKQEKKLVLIWIHPLLFPSSSFSSSHLRLGFKNKIGKERGTKRKREGTERGEKERGEKEVKEEEEKE